MKNILMVFMIILGLSSNAQDLKPNDSLSLLVLKLETTEKTPIEGQFLKIIKKHQNLKL
mgnify:CR=1 FL=1